MDFGTLALIVAAGLLGPLLAARRSWHVPVVVGALLAGVLLGRTGLQLLDTTDPTFTFLADIGFALVMFVAGSHVPIRDPRLRQGIGLGLARAVLVGIVATAAGLGLAALFGTGNGAIYAVLMASSSAAIVLPIVDSLGLTGPPVLQLLPQVAVADAACIVALPLVIDPARAGRAAIGALAVVAFAIVVFALLWWGERSGLRRRVHRISEDRKFALELRLSLLALFALAAVATWSHVSIMLAGFALGLAVAAIGEPRRLARQLFAISDGFFAPLFFVWLGASLAVRDLGERPGLILLGVLLGVGAPIVHLAGVPTGQPVSMAALSCAQMGVPVAAATLATQLGLLGPGEAPAMILGALITIGVTVLAGAAAARRQAREPAVTPPAG
ncbi:cation:proton antiporter [Nakamurella sp.]|uniref:cation:proton antiporter n=1 Tax=Nakamurella sp. TaxID=1869182 RepID=UPI003B3B042D